MKYRRAIWMVVLGLLLALTAAGSRAADSRFSLDVRADGVTLGTAAATLSVVPSTPGYVTWTLSDATFTEAPNPDGKLKWSEGMLSGSGSAEASGTAVLKEFDITVQQSTGVDVTYRFHLSATLADGAVKSVSIEQAK